MTIITEIKMLKRKLFAVVLMCLSIAAVQAETWTVNQKDADIRVFVEQVASITGRTFLVDPAVKGKITVISSKGLSKNEVYDVFLNVLRIHGYAAVTRDGVTQIIKQSDVKAAGGELIQQRELGPEFVTRVLFIQNRSAMELVPILRPMVAKYGHLAGVPSANAIIVSDHASNIQRIVDLIQSLDVVTSEEIEIVTLEEAWVGNIVGLLEKLVPEEVAAANANNRNSGGQIRVVADETSNSIILKGEKAYRDRIKALIKKLDKPSTQNTSSKVIFLNHSDSKTMAEILKGFSGAVQKSQQQQGGAAAPPAEPISILSDEALNALVIRAEPTILVEIEAIIQQLDIPRAQVLIEAVIVEVSESFGRDIGVQMINNPETAAEDGTPAVGTQLTAGSQLPLSSIVTGTAAAISNGLTLGLVDGDSWGAVLQAIESNTNSNILSTPSVMTLNNNEASILVGENRPFKTTTQSTSGGNPFTTFETRDIGTSLKVIPHIQKNGDIRLEVEQKTENASTETLDGSETTITNKREIKTEVLVSDGETIVLGGLIRDEETVGVNKVPLLGDIPGLGVLFRSKSHTTNKVNLLVFIRPTIVNDRVTELSDNKLKNIWEMRISHDKGEQVPSFNEVFNSTYD